MGELCAQIHRDHGVDLRCGVSVEGFDGSERVERARLSDGSVAACDLVVVGIGAVPDTDWLEPSGLALDNGIVCDAYCRTRVTDVFAAGDVANFYHPRFDEIMRLEHWSNAVEQGVHAAEDILAGQSATPYLHTPWFWSDQYSLTIQFTSRMRVDDKIAVVAGSVEERKFTALYGRCGALVGVLAFNTPRALRRYSEATARLGCVGAVATLGRFIFCRMVPSV